MDLPIVNLTVKPHWESLIVISILTAFIVLAVGFSLGPILEGPDEGNHYLYGRYIAQTKSLPDPRVAQMEYHQAPLYYILIAPFTFVQTGSTYAFGEGRNNPYFYINSLSISVPGNDNKNLYLHSRAEEFPVVKSTMARAIHLARIFSIVCGAGTVIVCYAVFRILWPQHPNRRILALGIVAFWPQFIYTSGVVSNDSLLILLATLSLWLVLREHHDETPWRNAALLGIVLGAALLTKVSAIFLVFPVSYAVLLNLRHLWRYIPLTLAFVIGIAGWWYLRNAILYQDPFLSKTFDQAYSHAAIGTDGWNWKIALAHAPQAYNRVWARFGWLTVAVGYPIYRFFDVFTALGIGGASSKAIRRLWKGTGRSHIHYGILISVFVLAWVVSLLYNSGRDLFGYQGRFLLPGIVGWAAIFSMGLDTLTPRRLRMPVALGSVFVLATVATVCLFGYFLPAYWPSPLPDHIEHPLSLRYENAAELIGVQSEVNHARPGQTIYVTLYWRAIQPTDANLTAFVHSVGSNVVYRDSFPATGNLLSTDWLPGQTWAERYTVIIPQDSEEQVAYSLMAGLYETDTQRALIATDSEGREVTPLVGQIVINGPTQPFEPDYRFGDIIGLAEPKIARNGGNLRVCLRWVSLALTSMDYHVFVHVLSADGDLIAQTDTQPKGGLYPTSAWTVGEAVDDCVTLDAARLPDDWQVAVGLYELSSGQRLPVVDREGLLLDNGMVVIVPQ